MLRRVRTFLYVHIVYVAVRPRLHTAFFENNMLKQASCDWKMRVKSQSWFVCMDGVLIYDECVYVRIYICLCVCVNVCTLELAQIEQRFLDMNQESYLRYVNRLYFIMFMYV